MTDAAIERIKQAAAIAHHLPPPGRTVVVRPCRFCLCPMWRSERNSEEGEGQFVVDDGDDSGNRLCNSCERIAYRYPEVVAWVEAVLQAHMVACHSVPSPSHAPPESHLTATQ